MSDFTYQGVDHHGNSRGGVMPHDSAAELARRLYLAGWRWAEITVDGRLVGEVTRDLNGHRTWYGEKAGAQPKPPKTARRRRVHGGVHLGEIR